MTPTAASTEYQGTELPVFAEAHNWKRYIASLLRPYIRGEVLEVGAGMGATTRALLNPSVTRWVALEPDLRLASTIAMTIERGDRTRVEVSTGEISTLAADAMFDTIIYIDVLEHIDDDAGELRMAAAHLRSGGRLVVLAPAFPSAFSEFDRAVGHFRRYTKASLARAMPPGFRQVVLRYADSLGLLLSFLNRFVMHNHAATHRQVQFWDRVIVPISRLTDVVARRWAGKSVIGVFQCT